MTYTNVPKDLNKIKSKIVFNLTKRQLICFGTAAAVGLPIYFFTRNAVGNSFAVLLMMGVMAPFFLLAMYEKDGLPAEKRLRNFIRTKFYWPQVRTFKTENFYETLAKEERSLAKTTTQTSKRAKQTPKPKYQAGKGESKSKQKGRKKT